MDVVCEIVYVMIKENVTIHRKMKQKNLGIMLQDSNIELVSVNETKSIYKSKRR